MSRIGRMPITIPAGVDVTIDGQHVTVKKDKNVLEMNVDPSITVTKDGDDISVERHSDDKTHRSLHGLTRALINNMVVGVSEGFKKDLEINGVGYRAEKKGNDVVFHLGYSHPIEFKTPEGITIDVPSQTTLTVKGADKQLVGETAAKIKSLRVPDVYKGKGIKYAGEHLIIKEGKTGAKK